MEGNREDVRELIDYLDEETAREPEKAIRVASDHLASDLDGCARAEILMARGTAYRTIGELDRAESDFDRAESTCKCEGCNPRLLRRRAPLLTMHGDHPAALGAADEAVRLFTLSGNSAWLMRSRAVRGVVRYFADLKDGALEDAAAAYAYFARCPRANLLQYGCAAHEYAALLMAFGEWGTAYQVLTAPALKYVNGFDVLRLRLRWCLILCEIALGLIDPEIGGERIERVLKHLQGRSLPVHSEQARVVKTRVERAKPRNVLHIAALTADAALFGRMREVSKGAREALRLLPTDTSEDLRRHLEDLADLAEADAPDVERLRRVALDVRAHCSGAPTLPPNLTA